MTTGAGVPIADPVVGDEEKSAVAAVLDSGHLAAGEMVDRFETAFAAYCDTAHGVATSNGTTALHAALEGLEIGEGDRVLTTPFTFVATANAIRFTGAEPVFADVDPVTYNLDPSAVRTAFESADGAIDAILAVHLYGLPAPLDELADVAATYDVPLVEDCAQAHGARHRGRPVGSVGDAGCFSFYPTKNMTTGEGGIVVTDRDDVAERVRRFIDHGRTGRYEHVSLGHNFRLQDVAAAIGCAQLERLPRFVERRRANAERLDAGLAETGLACPADPDGCRHAYNQYTVRCPERDALRRALSDAGVATGVYYPAPVHEQPAYDAVDCTAPVAEQAADEVLSLPVHPGLSDADLDAVVSAVLAFES